MNKDHQDNLDTLDHKDARLIINLDYPLIFILVDYTFQGKCCRDIPGGSDVSHTVLYLDYINLHSSCRASQENQENQEKMVQWVIRYTVTKFP